MELPSRQNQTFIGKVNPNKVKVVSILFGPLQ